MPRIPVSGPSITELEVEYVADAVRRCWYGNANEYHERFERVFARYVGTKHAVALPSCTSALHLALAALGIGPGDEVIVPDVTWIATAAPISYVGATPVFADIDPVTWCISAEACRALRDAADESHHCGRSVRRPARLARPAQLADESGLALIEDAAEAIGSEYQGRRAGSLGDVGVVQLSRLQDDDHRRRRHAGDRSRRPRASAC